MNRQLNRSWRRFIKTPMLRRIADLRIPALRVAATDDIRPTRPVEQLAHLLPQGKLAKIDGAGHNLWLTHAATLGRVVRGFLGELASSAGHSRGSAGS